MNEEQNDPNIPAPVPPDNNQNIAPTNRWQIKSWQILLVGIIFYAIVYPLYTGVVVFEKPFNLYNIITNITEFYFISFAYFFFILIPFNLVLWFILLFLFSDKTRKIGAAASITFGILIILIAAILGSFITYGGALGFFLLFVGFHAYGLGINKIWRWIQNNLIP